MNENEITVEIGSHNTLIIDKLYGPLCMAQLRLTIDSYQGEYIIERLKIDKEGIKEEWDIVARINGCVEDEE